VPGVACGCGTGNKRQTAPGDARPHKLRQPAASSTSPSPSAAPATAPTSAAAPATAASASTPVPAAKKAIMAQPHQRSCRQTDTGTRKNRLAKETTVGENRRPSNVILPTARAPPARGESLVENQTIRRSAAGAAEQPLSTATFNRKYLLGLVYASGVSPELSLTEKRDAGWKLLLTSRIPTLPWRYRACWPPVRSRIVPLLSKWLARCCE